MHPRANAGHKAEDEGIHIAVRLASKPGHINYVLFLSDLQLAGVVQILLCELAHTIQLRVIHTYGYLLK